jgi:hypothetical protein
MKSCSVQKNPPINEGDLKTLVDKGLVVVVILYFSRGEGCEERGEYKN